MTVPDVFTKERVRSVVPISERLVHDVTFTITKYDFVKVELVAEMDGFLLRAAVDEIPVEVAVKFDVPATWWQALKAEHLPNCLRERWPVRYKSVTKTGHKTVSVVAALDGFAIPADQKIVRLAFVKTPRGFAS